MQTFLWGWITLKIFSLILLDMPLENVLSSWPVLQQIPLPFPSYGRSWRSYLRNWTLLLQPLFLWGQVPSQRSLLKTSQHNSVATQDVESRACAFSVPAMKSAREGLEIKTFGSWLASPSTLGEAGKTGTVETLLGWVVPLYTNQPLRTISRAFEF